MIQVIEIDPGREVICDMCNKEWTDDPTSGGFLMCSHAFCPDCVDDGMASAKKYGEEHLIKHCPEGMSFADWIRSIR